jgi:AraC family transcriptional activator of pobA
MLAAATVTLAPAEPPPGEAAVVPAGQDLRRLQRFRTLVESHYLKHWPVERYAAHLALSESSLNRLCRALTGTTAFDIIQQRLALEARRRLAFVAGSVATLAAELGFKDPAYFSRFFHKHNGMSPTQFRRRQAGG